MRWGCPGAGSLGCGRGVLGVRGAVAEQLDEEAAWDGAGQGGDEGAVRAYGGDVGHTIIEGDFGLPEEVKVVHGMRDARMSSRRD